MSHLAAVCNHIHNYFIRENHTGTFTITDGVIDLPDILPGQRFMITGSAMNDGIYTWDSGIFDDDAQKAETLTNETFTGTVSYLAVPKAFLLLVDEIKAWREKYEDAANSPFTSESFGGYSYSKAGTGGTGGNSGRGRTTWETAFADRLNPYRKLA
jgi:hypothetical protein